MKRGEVWEVNFGPSVGGEIKKRRPAYIVSHDAANKFLSRVLVVPLSSNVDRLYPSEAPVVPEGARIAGLPMTWPASSAANIGLGAGQPIPFSEVRK